MREKLIELQKEVLVKLPFPWCTVWRDVAEQIADNLIANGVTIQRWIPVTERLPKAYTDVLAYRKSGCEVECCIDIHSNFWLKDPTSEHIVTHWMPLPEAPKGE